MCRHGGTVLLAVALTATLSCTVDDPTTGVQFFPQAYADFMAAEPLRVSTPSTMVFRDQAAWDAFWQANVPFAPPPPAVDFSQQMLIGVFWGATGTGCFNFVDAIRSVNVRIDGVNTTGVLEIDIGPLPNLGICATPVNPLQVIVMDTTITPVQFIGMVPS